jgi:hypothetical protein
MKVIAFDTETYYDKECSVRTLGPWAYTRHPDFYCYLISVFDGENSWVGEPKDFDWSMLAGAHVLSHNAAFDMEVYQAGVEKGLYPKVNYAQWDCTANLAAFLCNERALDKSVQLLFGEKISKAARANMTGKHWGTVKGTKQGEEFLKYADFDARWCWRLFNDFGHLWPEHERVLSRLTIEQGMRGVHIDRMLLLQYLEVAKELVFRIEAKLPWVADGERPTGTKIICEKCKESGIPTPPVKSRDGEEAFDEWESYFAPKYPWVAAVSQWRVANKLKTTLASIDERTDDHDIFRFGMKYWGGHTGRWSGDTGFNMQNMRRDPVLIDKDWVIRDSVEDVAAYYDGDPDWFAHAIDIRSLFTARPGKKLVICDLSQIEPRVLAWLSGDEKMLSKLSEGYGVYEAAAVASGVYTGPKGGFKKDKLAYAAQKAKTLGLGYGCGWKKYIDVGKAMANYDVCQFDDKLPDGTPVFGSRARAEVSAWRNANPCIVNLWRMLDTNLRNSVGQKLELALPSGRSMTYHDLMLEPKIRTIEEVDTKTGKITVKRKQTEAVTGRIGLNRYTLYGGLLTENITQAVARDVFAACLLDAILCHNLTCLWTAHDEAIFEVDNDVTPEFVVGIFSDTPAWLPGCPIGAEAKESHRYLK